MEEDKNADSGLPEKPREDARVGIGKRLLEQDPLVRAVTRIITEAVDQRASDVLIEPLDEELLVRFRIDGVLRKSATLSKSLHEGVISRIKVMSGLDISEHRLPQDGRFKMVFSDKDVDLRVSVVPSYQGEKIALRILDKANVILDLDRLGFDPRSSELLKRNLAKPFGMILVCGPTGCGKTTTLYAALKYIDTIEKNIVTVEDPIEYQLYGINQVAVSEDIGLTFAAALRSILRQDPNIVLVGEIRDFETADIAVKSALTGHLILSTLHTTSATGSVVRLVNMGIEPFLLASSCLVIASQVLVRALCPQCKEAYQPLKPDLECFSGSQMSLSKDAVLYREKGCTFCGNTGFNGRLAVIETIEITEQLRDLIAKGASESELKEAAKSAGLNTLRDNGLKLAQQGLTTIAEVIRATSGE